MLGLHGLLPDAGPHGNPLLDKLLGCSGTSDQEVGSAGPAPALHRLQAGPGSWETPLSHPDPGWDLALSSLLIPVVTSSSWDLRIQQQAVYCLVALQIFKHQCLFSLEGQWESAGFREWASRTSQHDLSSDPG